MSLNIEYLNIENYDATKPTESRANPNEHNSNKANSFVSQETFVINHTKMMINNSNDEFYKDFLFRIKEDNKNSNIPSEEKCKKKTDVVLHSQNDHLKKRNSHQCPIQKVQSFNWPSVKNKFDHNNSSNSNTNQDHNQNQKQSKEIGKDNFPKKESSFKNQNKNNSSLNTHNNNTDTIKKSKGFESTSKYKNDGTPPIKCSSMDKEGNYGNKPQVLVIERIKSIEDINNYLRNGPMRKNNINSFINEINRDSNAKNCNRFMDKNNSNKLNANVKITTRKSSNKSDDQSIVEMGANINMQDNNDENLNKQLSLSTEKQVKKRKRWFFCCFPA